VVSWFGRGMSVGQGCPSFGKWQAIIIFFLKLVGQCTNNIVLRMGGRAFSPFPQEEVSQIFFDLNGEWRILVHADCYFCTLQ